MSGITGINLPALEKRFQFTSKDLGLIAASNDLSAILLICFVSFYGQFGNKVKWLGYGAMVTGECAWVSVLPTKYENELQFRTVIAGTRSSKSVSLMSV